MKHKAFVVIASILLITFIGVSVDKIRSGEQIKQFQKIQLQNRDNELKLEQIETEKLRNRLNDGEQKSQEEIKQLRDELEQRRENEERLERELQAKLQRQKEEEERIAQSARTAINTVTATQTASASVSYSGDKHTWLRASGIPEGSWGYVDSIVSGESGWNPNAVNRSSGACGLGQQLPCGKWGGDWRDPVHALKSMHIYVQAYGGWAEAVSFRNCTGTCWSNRTNSNVYKSHTWY